MTQTLPARMRRGRPVRANSDLLTEGVGDTYGWVSNQAGPLMPGVSPDRPSWWLGNDRFDGAPIGPNGPGAGFGWDRRGGWRSQSWWNRPAEAGLLPAVTRATTVIVNPIVRTPWEVYRERSDGAVEVFTQLPLWLRDPTLRWSTPGPITSLLPISQRKSAHEFWQTILTHALWWGRGAFVAQEAADGQPLPGTCLILNPFALSVSDEPGTRGHWVVGLGDATLTTDYDGRFTMGGVSWRVWSMRGLPPNDDATPEGVLVRHFDVLRLGASIQTYQGSSFGNGVPAGYLKVTQPNFDEAKAAALKKMWMQAHGGDEKSIAVLNAMVDFTAIQAKPVDNETTTLKFANLVDVAHGFGLSASWMDTSAGASMTYANITDKRKELLDISLTGIAQQFMEMLNACMAYGTSVRVMWARFTSPDLEQQATTLTQAVQAGWLTVNEARERVGLPPLPSGDALALPAGAGDAAARDVEWLARRALDMGVPPIEAVRDWYGDGHPALGTVAAIEKRIVEAVTA